MGNMNREEASAEFSPQEIRRMMRVLIDLAEGTSTQPPPAPVSADEYLTLSELAERIKMGTSTIRRWKASGKLREGEHFVRKGRKLLFIWSKVEAWLREPGSEPQHHGSDVIPFVRKGRRRG